MNQSTPTRDVLAVAILAACMFVVALVFVIGGVLVGWVVLEWAIVHPTAALIIGTVGFGCLALVALWQERWR